MSMSNTTGRLLQKKEQLRFDIGESLNALMHLYDKKLTRRGWSGHAASVVEKSIEFDRASLHGWTIL